MFINLKDTLHVSSASNSELVIPIVVNGQGVGVLDIDSFHFNRFDELEEKTFKAITSLIEKKLSK
jgi:L-methionine (R)-S-oxide reductase